MKKILFIAVHRPFRSPSQRFRFDQYMDFFQQNGYEITYSSLISESDDVWFYKPGHMIKKIWLIVKSIFIRINDVSRASKFDYVFVQREAIMLGTSWFERQFAKKSILVYDFDDSIWLLDVSAANKGFGWLKRPQKTAEIIQASSLVFAGNEYLANYARTFNKQVLVVPTVLKTADVNYTYFNKIVNDPLVIGWIGSTTTIKHIEWAQPILKRVLDDFFGKVKLVVVADKKPLLNDIDFEFRVWSPEVEKQLLTSMDIGIMPLPDDEWTRGKCGFKGLQCMSYGIPVVMSAVGVNSQIISHGENGFLANDLTDWTEMLKQLIQEPWLRTSMGEKGRGTVVNSYSLEHWQEMVVIEFQKLKR